MIKYFIIITTALIALQLKAQTTTDAAGKKQGYWKKVDTKTGKLIYEGLFKDDKPQGLFKYYYPHDSIKAKMFFIKDGKMSYSTMYHITGKKMAYGKYIGEEKDSVWNYYDDKGVLISMETFTLGKKNGKALVYFPDGVVSEERNFKNNLQDGTFKLYFDKKTIRGEGTYVNGKLEGKNTYNYPNGIAAATGYYKNDKKVGPWIYRDTKGKVTEKELYKQNGEQASPKETLEFFNKNKPIEAKPKPETKDPKAVGTKTTSTKPKGTK